MKDYLDTEYDSVTDEYRVIGEPRTALVPLLKPIHSKKIRVYTENLKLYAKEKMWENSLTDRLDSFIPSTSHTIL